MQKSDTRTLTEQALAHHNISMQATKLGKAVGWNCIILYKHASNKREADRLEYI